jgi:hypothetical protein
VVYSSSGNSSAECGGGSCEGQAEGEASASASCSLAPGGFGAPFGGAFLSLLGFGSALVARRRKRG